MWRHTESQGENGFVRRVPSENTIVWEQHLYRGLSVRTAYPCVCRWKCGRVTDESDSHHTACFGTNGWKPEIRYYLATEQMWEASLCLHAHAWVTRMHLLWGVPTVNIVLLLFMLPSLNLLSVPADQLIWQPRTSEVTIWALLSCKHFKARSRCLSCQLTKHQRFPPYGWSETWLLNPKEQFGRKNEGLVITQWPVPNQQWHSGDWQGPII